MYPMTSVLCLTYFLLVYGPELPKEPSLQHGFSCTDCELRRVQDRPQIPSSF